MAETEGVSDCVVGSLSSGRAGHVRGDGSVLVVVARDGMRKAVLLRRRMRWSLLQRGDGHDVQFLLCR